MSDNYISFEGTIRTVSGDGLAALGVETSMRGQYAVVELDEPLGRYTTAVIGPEADTEQRARAVSMSPYTRFHGGTRVKGKGIDGPESIRVLFFEVVSLPDLPPPRPPGIWDRLRLRLGL